MTNQKMNGMFDSNPGPQTKINLVLSVKELLDSHGLQKECREAFINSATIMEVTYSHATIQRTTLNSFFLHQLVPYGSETIEERFCLVSDGAPEEWLRLFKAVVLPFLISKRIPVIIH